MQLGFGELAHLVGQLGPERGVVFAVARELLRLQGEPLEPGEVLRNALTKHLTDDDLRNVGAVSPGLSQTFADRGAADLHLVRGKKPRGDTLGTPPFGGLAEHFRL